VVNSSGFSFRFLAENPHFLELTKRMTASGNEVATSNNVSDGKILNEAGCTKHIFFSRVCFFVDNPNNY